ncbi:unnamed protein product, partial [Protopolystoma xenopodis]
SGIAEIKTILCGFTIPDFLGPWVLIAKFFSLLLAVSSGLFIGYEGPMVHVAACWSNLVAMLMPRSVVDEVERRELLSASVAAGISASFGAPIGGVLFSLEEASSYFPLKTLFRCFFCAFFAASMAHALMPFDADHLVMFAVDYEPTWHLFELVPFSILGVLGVSGSKSTIALSAFMSCLVDFF